MKRLIPIIILFFISCGGGGGGSWNTNSGQTPSAPVIGDNAPVLSEVLITDGYFSHAPPKIWHNGETWQFTLSFNDPDDDAESVVCYLYNLDWSTYSGPFILDLEGEIRSFTGGNIIVDAPPSIYKVGFTIVDSKGNESAELYEEVRVITL